MVLKFTDFRLPSDFNVEIEV